MQRLPLGLTLALGGLGLLTGPLQAAHDHHSDHRGAEQTAESARVHFIDAALVDQQERQVHLADEVVADRIVVIGFIYTSCTTVCPVVSAIMQKVQARLGERVGTEVRLVSISIDPLRDTPARLREYSRAYQAGSGWTWLTGPVQEVNDTLKGLGVWSADFADHQPVILVGDGRSGRWTRFQGFTDPSVLVAKVDELSAARGDHDMHGDMLRQASRVEEDRP